VSGGTKVMLIGGTSHVGKSTFARRLAESLEWNNLSTDQLARHPGRPWRNDQSDLPEDVVAHYSGLSATELLGSVSAHYQQNVWPIVDALVRSHLNNPFEPCLVFEGSAILPERVVGSQFERVSCVWLTASDDLITTRILGSSEFDQRAEREKWLITAFLERTLAFNNMIMESLDRLGQASLDVERPDLFDELLSYVDNG